MNAIIIICIGMIVLLLWIRGAFREEIRACFDRDPAARTTVEVILTYAGLHALIAHRIAHTLLRWHIPILPRLLSQWARFVTGIEIHPGADIGPGLFIDHGMGVVIGETAVIGRNVTIFQGVTLGGTGKERGKRHPTLSNDVVIGAGAKVLGNITVSDHVAIGANAVVIRDVPANSTVVGVPGRIVKTDARYFPGMNLDHTALPDPIAERLEKLQEEIDLIEGHLKDHRRDVRHS
jgi:serine O-acetyltransferase